MTDAVITDAQENPHAHKPHRIEVAATMAERETVEQHCLHAFEAGIIKSYDSSFNYTLKRYLYTIEFV